MIHVHINAELAIRSAEGIEEGSAPQKMTGCFQDKPVEDASFRTENRIFKPIRNTLTVFGTQALQVVALSGGHVAEDGICDAALALAFHFAGCDAAGNTGEKDA